MANDTGRGSSRTTSVGETLDLHDYIRTVPNWPNPGVMFRDITPLLGNYAAFKETVDQLVEPFRDSGITKVAAFDARGFIFGGPAALELRVPFVPFRKPGKLPFDSHSVAYDLEYGSGNLEMHVDAVGPSDKVLMVDDLIATGGTAVGGIELIREYAGAEIMALSCVIDLPDLNGADRIRSLGVPVHSLISFEGE